ncbi:Zinc finger MYND domain-containing protein 11 [Fasciola gigantica]|uniref:Zinc finger MYND domain-containing protein 11 n=1 Tax=Fasciola gigantica TaxID=46835 RepID=A0A504YQD8_FASGI|nr:Zinc finger MYND domain-containing protein 11 [Fasciola gigantica]
MDYAKLKNYRHADPLKVRQVWDTLGAVKGQRVVVPSDKLVKSLRKRLDLKDDQIRLLLDEIEGDGLIEKIDPSFGKSGPVSYRLPDFTKPCPRGKHDWYCFQCHKPGEVLKCTDCFRVYHLDCAQEASKSSSPSGKSLRSPTLHDGFADDFSCPVCESRPKCEFSRKQIRKLLEFATHHLRKQSLWKTFIQIGYRNEINKNEFLAYKYTDLDLLQRKIKDGRYAALEEFSMDVQLLVHNVCILHGLYSEQADEVRVLLRSVNTELKEIQLCTDCYINAKTRLSDWISKPCKPPHELIWACNRTPTGAGLFSDAVISQYYWPAKVLLERDDAYEIRFFGGTHERALVKKSNTRPFHLPADEIGVLRRGSSSTGALPGGGFERAWNEVSKLQANIDSGYYTHSSGESDLPPSDDEYSDEIYLGPRRGKLSLYQRTNRTHSPHSSNNSASRKGGKRRRRTSSSSHQTTTSASPTVGEPSPLLGTSPTRGSQDRASHKSYKSLTRTTESSYSTLTYGDKKRPTARITMPAVQPGTPGAAAISALAETKAAMAAAVGNRSSNALTSDLFSLTSRHDSDTFRGRFGANKKTPPVKAIRGRRGRGRPPKTDSGPRRSIRARSSSSSPSVPNSAHSPISSSDSLSDVENDLGDNHVSTNSDDSGKVWNPRQKNSTQWKTTRKTIKSSRGRPKGRGRAKTINPFFSAVSDSGLNRMVNSALSSDNEEASELWSELSGQKSKRDASPIRGRGRPNKTANHISPGIPESGSKKRATPNKDIRTDLFSSRGKKPRKNSMQLSSVDRRDEDDELTDRCCSPVAIDSPGHKNRAQRGHRRYSPHAGVPSMRSPLGAETRLSTQHSPVRRTGLTSAIKLSPSKRNEVLCTLQRSSQSSNCDSYSSPSSSDIDGDNGLVSKRKSAGRVVDDDRKFHGPNRVGSGGRDVRNSSSGVGSTTMLRRPPFAPPLGNANTSGINQLSPDRSALSAAANLLYSHAAQNFSSSPDPFSVANAPTAAVLAAAVSLAGSNHPMSGSQSSAALGLLSANSSSNAASLNNLPGHTAGVSALPRSHLPPNKRAAAAATAAALSGTGTGPSVEPGHALSQQSSPRGSVSGGLDAHPQMSPRKLAHKGVQTPACMEANPPCSECKQREAERLSEAAEHKQALRELEERLTTQFKEEKAVATQAAIEQAHANMHQAIEREQKLAHEAREAAEARFAEIIVQTKRRQWCRNCLSEAIYHCCWNTSYCSIQCQQEHWQKEHKRQCRRKR